MPIDDITLPDSENLADLFLRAHALQVGSVESYEENYELFNQAAKMRENIEESLKTLYRVRDSLDWMIWVANRKANLYLVNVCLDDSVNYEQMARTTKRASVTKIDDIDENLLPEQFFRVDKKALEEHLREGVEIPGVTASNESKFELKVRR